MRPVRVHRRECLIATMCRMKKWKSVYIFARWESWESWSTWWWWWFWQNSTTRLLQKATTVHVNTLELRLSPHRHIAKPMNIFKADERYFQHDDIIRHPTSRAFFINEKFFFLLLTEHEIFTTFSPWKKFFVYSARLLTCASSFRG